MVLGKAGSEIIFASLLRISLNKNRMKLSKYILPLFFAGALVSCSDDDDNTPEENGGGDNGYTIPSTYVFEDADGNSTVSYSGQTDRLNQLGEMTTMMKSANTAGTSVIAQNLTDMFANVGENGGGNFSFSSSKQLKNKCANQFSDGADIQADYEGWMNELAAISTTTVTGENNASNGVAGTIVTNGSGPYLVNENGIELTQIIEKGLMGAVFYHQIVSYYLTDAKIGDGVDNTTAVDAEAGKYYTAMEHHWDEAFGYFTSDTNFPDNDSKRFWGKYCNTVDPHLGTNAKIMDAYLEGRAAIANDDHATKIEMRDIIIAELERVAAGTAIHYLNGAHANFTNDAKRNHELSEAIAFLYCLRYNTSTTISYQEVQAILDTIGDNCYDVTMADLMSARDALSAHFGMDAVKDVL